MVITALVTKVKRNMSKLIRFGVVGATGAAINFAVYYWVSELLSLSVNLSAIAAFGVSVINNYILNHCWTFSAENEGNPINIKQLLYYVAGNLQGLAINLVVLNAVIYFLGMDLHLMGQASGILCGMLSNFVFAKKVVFSEKRRKNRRV